MNIETKKEIREEIKTELSKQLLEILNFTKYDFHTFDKDGLRFNCKDLDISIVVECTQDKLDCAFEAWTLDVAKLSNRKKVTKSTITNLTAFPSTKTLKELMIFSLGRGLLNTKRTELALYLIGFNKELERSNRFNEIVNKSTLIDNKITL